MSEFFVPSSFLLKDSGKNFGWKEDRNAVLECVVLNKD